MNVMGIRSACRPLAAACIAAALLAFGFVGTASAQPADGPSLTAQDVTYLPDVTEQMTKPAYWSAKQADPDALLADRATIDALNQAGIDGDGTMLQPLKDAAERFYTQDEQKTLKRGVEGDLAYFVSVGAEDLQGNALTEEEAAAIAANVPTDGSTPDIASGYAIVTTHTTMRNLPTDRMMGETPGDQDDDNLYLAMLRVNEPLLVRAQSVDGRFFLCISSCMQASWVPAEDIAICANRDEWLDAWDVPAGKELVVYGYKVRTEQSRVTPHTANRLLYMGTVLESIDWDDASALVGTRSVYNNHVCYLPVRNDDGTYSKEVALIAESEKVSEGYLPLTTSGIADVAFNSLGQMYGWGGMLEANDCSGYVRDVYKCFGLELARNTTWQMNLPVRKYDLSGLDDAHKAAAIAQMPLGTVLFWGGHEMIYLGQEAGKLYVISSLGSIGNLFGDSGSAQVKSVAVNTLDMIRGNRNTWLTTLTTANIPYIPADASGTGLDDVAFYDASITWPEASYEYAGTAIAPEVGIPGLVAGTDYEVAFEGNDKPGTATVTVTGAGAYSGEISRTFEIVAASPESSEAAEPVTPATVAKKANTMTVTAKKVKAKAKKKTTIKAKKAFTVSNAQGAVSFKKVKGNKKIKVGAAGKVTVKKGLKKGKTYKVKVSVTAAGNAEYEPASIPVTLKVKVR